jgi:Zn-dependent M28 family amino/carboxypeptidase
MIRVRFTALCASVALFGVTLPPQPSASSLAAPDPEVSRALASISPARLRSIDLTLVGFGTRSTFSEAGGRQRGAFAARDWIADQFRAIARASHRRMSVALDTYTRPADGKQLKRDVVISSVLATLTGDEPGSRTYVISSHYDSRNSDDDDGVHDAPGADDNASGVACVLEAARALASMPLHATVIFAAFEGEEQGLYGSEHVANGLKAGGVDVEGDLNNDIVGSSTGPQGETNPTSVRIFSEALAAGASVPRVNATGSENDSPSRELARYVKDVGDVYAAPLQGLLVFRADRFLRGGDHESFNAAGFPAIRFTEPVEDFRHQHQDVRVENGVQYGDLPAYVDFDYLAQVTRYNTAALASLARGPGRPPGASIVVSALTNDTTLRWQPVPGATRYEIVRRATTDAVWQTAQDAGDVTQITLPQSKDDWLFGIRAVDADGRRSVVAFPAPVR